MRRVEMQRSNFCMKDSVAPAGAWFVRSTFPTADAVGYLRPPLRGCAGTGQQEGNL